MQSALSIKSLSELSSFAPSSNTRTRDLKFHCPMAKHFPRQMTVLINMSVGVDLSKRTL